MDPFDASINKAPVFLDTGFVFAPYDPFFFPRRTRDTERAWDRYHAGHEPLGPAVCEELDAPLQVSRLVMRKDDFETLKNWKPVVSPYTGGKHTR
jgi:hypothetical protein